MHPQECSCIVLINAYARKDRQMDKKKRRKGKETLTDGPKSGDNQINYKTSASSSGTDPRILALVRFLARRAAEKDFAQLIEQSRRGKPGDEKERIQ